MTNGLDYFLLWLQQDVREDTAEVTEQRVEPAGAGAGPLEPARGTPHFHRPYWEKI